MGDDKDEKGDSTAPMAGDLMARIPGSMAAPAPISGSLPSPAPIPVSRASQATAQDGSDPPPMESCDPKVTLGDGKGDSTAGSLPAPATALDGSEPPPFECRDGTGDITGDSMTAPARCAVAQSRNAVSDLLHELEAMPPPLGSNEVEVKPNEKFEVGGSSSTNALNLEWILTGRKSSPQDRERVTGERWGWR
ncbi:hypothetical protein F2Q70_00018761 [Brassica cretica]|uniref:Uncharacterized protein n=1 Tax=Brassica cretica TaxID=69181 RepID=A0A8S9I4A2_BRACR|nr:hypothetical protein F2Q70_00018761 [Brassica cretica]